MIPTEAFAPDYTFTPGETLRETLEAMRMSQADLAQRAGLSTKHVNQIIQGVASITPETALILERVTGTPAVFWSNLEAQHQLAMARAAEEREADTDRAWIQSFPLVELERRGFIQDRGDPLRAHRDLLAFFGVASRAAWESIWASPQASFRRSRAYRVDDFATACWLRMGELEALETATEPFDAGRFRQALVRVRAAMTDEPSEWAEVMRANCAEAGVAVSLVAEMKGSRAHGAVRWIAPGKAVLQLSLRLRWEDHFWFSFFHEAGHLLLHGRRDPFVEDGSNPADESEIEADQFAMNTLIPEEAAARLPTLRSDADVKAFAQEMGVPPAIVVGRLQHDEVFAPNRGNGLRRRLEFASD